MPLAEIERALHHKGDWILRKLVEQRDRARRTLAAMRCRGFQGRLYLMDDLAWSAADTRLGAVLTLTLTALLALEHLP